MAARRFNLFDSTFTTGYTTGGRFGHRSRADQIHHHGRSGIDRRRHHSLVIESERGALVEALNDQKIKNQMGTSSQLQRDNLAMQTKATSGNQKQQFREENSGFRGNGSGRSVHFSEVDVQRNFAEDQPSRNTGYPIEFEDDDANRSRNSRTISRQETERFLDVPNRNTRPQRGSSYYNDVFSTTETPSLNSFRENTPQFRQQHQNNYQERDFTDSGQQQQQQRSMQTIQPNILREEVVWQPVKVIYVEKTLSDIKQGGTVPRQREYSSAAYGRESRAAVPQHQQGIYTDDWGGRPQDNGYVNRSYPPAYEATLNGNTNGDHRQIQVETQWSPPYDSREGSSRRSTEVFRSRDNPSDSTWNGNYQTVNMSPQRNDYVDGVSNSRSWASNRESRGRDFGYPTQVERNTYSQNGTLRTVGGDGLNSRYNDQGNESYGQNGTLRTGGRDGLNSRYTDQGNDSFTYRSQSQTSPRLLQNTGFNGSSFGARSQGRQVPIAQDDELPRSSRVNFSKTSGLELNGETSGGFRNEVTSHTGTKEDDEKEFFNKITKELENQRQNLKPEVDKLIRNSSMVTDDSDLTSRVNSITLEAGKNSYIDTSSPTPVFKAYVDISEFSPNSVRVNYDHSTNKIVVEAGQVNTQGTVGKTFTQKIALPKYADDLRLIARMNRSGVLRIEVPLLFYFPEEHEENKARSFLYEAKSNTADGSKALEIVVRPGSDYSLQDIQPEVVNNNLVIWGGRGNQKKSIGKYVLPPTADIRNIKHKTGRDGYLTVIIPVT